MLLDEFDSTKKAIINPELFIEKVEGMPRTCVSFFSKTIMKEITKNVPMVKIAEISNSAMVFPIYKINLNGTELAICQSPVGAPACVSNFEELIAMGVENFLLVGYCGCLLEEIEEYSIIIPTSAIRDEGTSYHYEPASDETEINKKVITILEEVIKSHDLKYRTGKTWTIDAIYRETKKKFEQRKKQGAITVDMECSAMNVVAKFRKVNFGQIFYAADNLGSEEYDPRSFGLELTCPHQKKKIIPLALECGIAMDKKL